MELSVSKIEMALPEEWDAFLAMLVAFSKETVPETYAGQAEILSSLAYHDHLLGLSERSDPPYRCVWLLQGQQPIGFADYQVFPLEHRKASLYRIFVLPAFRGQGAGSFLYQAIEKDVVELGGRYLELSAPEKALPFFCHQDFQKTNDHSLESGKMCYRKFLKRDFPYSKILVLGSPGAGKSYLSNQLSAIFGVPSVHMDVLYWRENWQHLSNEEMLGILEKITAKDAWIIDGNYPMNLEFRYRKADLIFFLDYPPELCLQGEKERRNHPRDDFPSFLKEGEDPGFVEAIASFPKNGRFPIVMMAEKYVHKAFIRFSSREECDQFLSLYRKSR